MVVVPQFLDILSLFFFSLFFLFAFQFWKNPIEKSSSSEILSSRVSSLLNSLKAFLISVLHFFLILSISFWFFHRISTSLPACPICSYKLSVLFIGTLSLLIIVVLNSRSDHSNISAIPKIDSDFLPFSMFYMFFLIATHDVLDERNAYK